MEKFKIYLYSTDPNSDIKMRWFLVIYGILFLSFGILLTYYDVTPPGNYFAMIAGIFSLIYALGYKKFVKRRHITLDDKGIKATIYRPSQITFRGAPFRPPANKINIRWEEIKSIDIKPLKIDADLIDGRCKEIELGDLMYRQHLLLKTKLQEYINAKEIIIVP